MSYASSATVTKRNGDQSSTSSCPQCVPKSNWRWEVSKKVKRRSNRWQRDEGGQDSCRNRCLLLRILVSSCHQPIGSVDSYSTSRLNYEVTTTFTVGCCCLPTLIGARVRLERCQDDLWNHSETEPWFMPTTCEVINTWSTSKVPQAPQYWSSFKYCTMHLF